MVSIKRCCSLLLPVLALSSSEANAEIPFIDQVTPGELRGIGRDPGDPWIYGYWEYLPTTYDTLAPGETLPLLVFLPGIGEYDDDSACPGDADVCAPSDCGTDGLCRNLHWGPQQHMAANDWDETLRPFIMISPQYDIPPFAADDWDLVELDAFVQFVVDNYPVDPRRMYLAGMSQGGRATLQYVGANGRRFTAASPMPGGVVAAGTTCSFDDTALWVFHGEDDNNGQLGDGVFAPCNMVAAVEIYEHPELHPEYSACTDYVGMPRPDGRITMFYDTGHFAWVPAIDPIDNGFAASEWASDIGCGTTIDFRQYSAALDSDGVYSWYLSLDRPDVVAPDDLELLGDAGSVDLQAVTTDDDAITYAWTQTAGPAATLTNADGDTLTASDLLPETVYTFEVFVTDSDNQWDRDEVTVTVLELPPSGSSDGGASTGSVSDTSPTTGFVSDSGGTGVVIDTDSTTGLVSDSNGASTSGNVGSSGGVSDTSPTTGVGTDSGVGTTSGNDGGTTGGEPGSTGGGNDTAASTGGSAATDTGAGTSAAQTDTGAVTSTGDGTSLDGSGSGPAVGTGTSGSEGAGGSEDSSGGQVDDNGGCGCVSDDRPSRGNAGWLALGLVAVARRRRRSITA